MVVPLMTRAAVFSRQQLGTSKYTPTIDIAKRVVKFLAKEACLRVTQQVLDGVAGDPDTLEVCQEARRQPRRLEDLARVAAWKTPITIRRRLLPKPLRKFVNFEEN